MVKLKEITLQFFSFCKSIIKLNSSFIIYVKSTRSSRLALEYEYCTRVCPNDYLDLTRPS